MTEKPRKFTNGYYPSYNSNCDDKSNIENSPSDNSLRFEKHSEKTIVERTDKLGTNWNKVKNQGGKEALKLIKSFVQDVEQEVGYLEDWMEENDEKVEEVKIYKVARWSSRKKMKKLSQYKDILTDIEVHGKLLKLLLSICKALAEDDLIDDDDQAIRRVKYLETVWHGVWLRAIEWECLIEQSLARRVDEGGDSGSGLYPAVDSGEEILKTIPETHGSEINVTNVKIRCKPEENLRNTRYSPIMPCHPAKTIHSEITRSGKSSPLCDSDCLSSDSGFSDLSSDFPTSLVRDIPPMCSSPTQKIIRKNATNLQKLGTEKQKKKHLRTLKNTKYEFCRQILSLIFLMFTFLILLLICNIKCYNNTCAIYINTHLQYYRGPPPF
eukprot:TRINITY_DN12803_c0_g1_i1.p1 TRINITY_DN12803_c0_g1~~TRINITY_DN12803_c0_g1_i1.p1  ORF type:complete len:382 (+),score=69.59 TRINITY_DN12803_c0_g1_i1:154-1299(+)